MSKIVKPLSFAIGAAFIGSLSLAQVARADTGFHMNPMNSGYQLGDKAPEGKSELTKDIQIGASPSGKAMKFQHRGPYDDIDATYEAITAYLDEKNIEAQNLFIEEYLTDPKAADDASLEVDIYVFIKG